MRKTGITLVEVSICIILSSLVLGAGYSIWTSSRRDFSMATTRQILQHEVRIALDTMVADFKSAQRNSFEFSGDTNQAKIKFKRFEDNNEQTKLDSQKVFDVVYTWNSTTKMLCRTAKGVSKYLSSNIIGINIEQGSAEGLDPNSPEALAKKARIDITLSAEKKVPLVGKIVNHTEKVSVVIRDEFYAGVNKSKYLALSELMEQDVSKIQTDTSDALLDAVNLSKDQVKNMETNDLKDLKRKEELCIKEMDDKIRDLNEQIGSINTENSRVLGFLWAPDTEFTPLQKAVKSHNDSESLKKDIEDIKKALNKREEEYFKKATGIERTPTDAERAAFDLKIKDWNAQKAWEAANKDKPESEKTPRPPSLLNNMDPSKYERGVTYDSNGQRITFDETEEAFKARQEYAREVFNASQKIDIEKLKNEVGDDGMRTFAAGKDLLELAEAKLAAAERKNDHQENLKIIQDELASRGA